MLLIVLVIVGLWATAAWLFHTHLNQAPANPALKSAIPSTNSVISSTSSAIPSITKDSITRAVTDTASASDSTTSSRAITITSVSITASDESPITPARVSSPPSPKGDDRLHSKPENDVSEEERELTRRQKLLRKRRRLISRLYDLNQDADEILRLYFTNSGGGQSASNSASRSASRERDSSAVRLLGVTTRRECTAGRSQAGLPTLRRRSEPVPSSSTAVSVRAGVTPGRISVAEDVPRIPVVRGSDSQSLGSSDDSGIGFECTDGTHNHSHLEPTIFGTVADDQTPRDNSTKRAAALTLGGAKFAIEADPSLGRFWPNAHIGPFGNMYHYDHVVAPLVMCNQYAPRVAHTLICIQYAPEVAHLAMCAHSACPLGNKFIMLMEWPTWRHAINMLLEWPTLHINLSCNAQYTEYYNPGFSVKWATG
ncbi:uncharacterized protein LOC121859920 [Homarus americanus]|uniref:uncharacterized protein LOC121859920 n=1 Tax=Homarus americanus TaxID=6706 RepID=UPI001C465340|nr:uncharacterized protein LOC121859920 [Homarus americanus]